MLQLYTSWRQVNGRSLKLYRSHAGIRSLFKCLRASSLWTLRLSSRPGVDEDPPGEIFSVGGCLGKASRHHDAGRKYNFVHVPVTQYDAINTRCQS